jgi:PucR family transcriptional regulator, purine catabolism regulatory protein
LLQNLIRSIYITHNIAVCCMESLTLDEVLRAALPLGTRVLVAADVLVQRPVRWVVTVSPNAAMPYLEGGEIVILLPGSDQNTLQNVTEFVRACAAANAAALVLVSGGASGIAPASLAAAEIAHLPVLQLPEGSRIRDVERMIMGLLLDQQGQIERRSTQIYRQLVQRASENAGLEAIVRELSRLVNKTVVLHDKNLRIKVAAVAPSMVEEWDVIAPLLTDRQKLPPSLRDRYKLPRHTSPEVRHNLREDGLARLITPIVNQGMGRGFLSFVGHSFDEVDMEVIDAAAVVCALEMARAKAISDVEKRLRGDFLDNLMAANINESEVVAEADRFGHDVSVPHVAMVLMWYPGKPNGKVPSVRRLETLTNGVLAARRASGQVNALTQIRETELRLFYGADSGVVATATSLGEQIIAEAKREFPDVHLAIGIGSIANKVSEWRASYREATQAADIARKLGEEAPMYIGDLGIYKFLARPEYREDLRLLRDSTIGNLIKYEERQRADLLQTLEAFFQCHGNHTQTAEMLSVHRNTLFYRMTRIAEITGLDLNRPDVRLAVHLALKIHRLLSVES